VAAYRIVRCCGSQNRLTGGGEVVSPKHWPHFTTQGHYFSASGTDFCYRLSKPQGLLQLEGIGKLGLELAAIRLLTIINFKVCENGAMSLVTALK
jgi:hypothetical protein